NIYGVMLFLGTETRTDDALDGAVEGVGCNARARGAGVFGEVGGGARFNQFAQGQLIVRKAYISGLGRWCGHIPHWTFFLRFRGGLANVTADDLLDVVEILLLRSRYLFHRVDPSVCFQKGGALI